MYFMSSRNSYYMSRSCKLPQLGPTLTLALSFTYSFTADSISLLTIWATWQRTEESGRWRSHVASLYYCYSLTVGPNIIAIPVWGLLLWFHRWAHRAAAGQSRLLCVETSRLCGDCRLYKWTPFDIIRRDYRLRNYTVAMSCVGKKKIWVTCVLVRERSCGVCCT